MSFQLISGFPISQNLGNRLIFHRSVGTGNTYKKRKMRGHLKHAKSSSSLDEGSLSTSALMVWLENFEGLMRIQNLGSSSKLYSSCTQHGRNVHILGQRLAVGNCLNVVHMGGDVKMMPTCCVSLVQ